MRSCPALLALILAAGCRSSAPHAAPSAALNTALAVGTALGQRAAGGCYATCSHGTTCNPRTGLCEAAWATEVCDQGETGAVRCVPVMGLGVSRPAEVAPAPSSPFGISPATGGVPPPPSEASPRPPGAP